MTKILIVDDDSVLSKMYKSAFEYVGFETDTATNGEEGLEKVEVFKPDVILSDIMMPRVDGLEFLKKVKENKKTKGIKVFIMTNLKDDENSETAIGLGAEKVIIKNEQGPTELVNIVKESVAP